MSTEKIFFYFLASMCALGLCLTNVLMSYIRKQHNATWEKLGSPSLITNNSIQNNLAFQRFLWKKEYRHLDDKKLNLLAGITRYFEVLYLLLFIGIVFSMFMHKS